MIPIYIYIYIHIHDTIICTGQEDAGHNVPLQVQPLPLAPHRRPGVLLV